MPPSEDPHYLQGVRMGASSFQHSLRRLVDLPEALLARTRRQLVLDQVFRVIARIYAKDPSLGKQLLIAAGYGASITTMHRIALRHRRHKVGMIQCSCGYKTCTDHWLTGVGKFVQGSGFTHDQGQRIAELINDDQDFPWHADASA
jgi:hypothetical protein